MKSGQRALSIAALGLFLVASPVQASLESGRAHAPCLRLVSLKSRMIASWYGKKFQGRKTASGELFDLHKLTAAHKSLPLGSLVRLTAESTGKSVIVRINDRGPWIKGRDFDLSEAAAIELGIQKRGIGAVEATMLESDVAGLANLPLH
jgi:rare lipoprotein A (peptidoglycan hydrolase)